MAHNRTTRTDRHHSHGGVLRHARLYEVIANAGFLGSRRKIWDRLVAALSAGAGDTVLDIGCGTGYFAFGIARKIEPGGTVIGIDPSPELIDYAERHAPANCSFQLAGAEDLPYPDETVDLVVSSLAIHHKPVDPRAAAMREMLRVLRPGGKLFIAEFAPPTSQFANRLLAVVGARPMTRDQMPDIEALAADARFRITGRGDVPRLRYLTAERPDAA